MHHLQNVRSTVAAYIALLPTLATAAGMQGLSQTCTLIGSIHGLGWIGSRSAASWLSDCVVFEARSTILSVLYVTKLIRIEYLCQALSTSRFRRAGSLSTAHTCYKWQDLGRRTNQTSFIFARQRSEDRKSYAFWPGCFGDGVTQHHHYRQDLTMVVYMKTLLVG